ncbi:MAG: hypothetical protein Q3976_07975 [Corynebacterium sp.]|nr:hypothetical protein [Corynebacterium sp.]
MNIDTLLSLAPQTPPFFVTGVLNLNDWATQLANTVPYLQYFL